ncbi:MAG: hypothetical protein HYV42_01315 [Candidatus Magasanikbacteria bacterium]|nr:hypothetical protein [Candidatus Magasanikbacteria bacterium]
MLDPTAKKYLLYGIGSGAAVVAIAVVFLLGVIYGPDLRGRLTNKTAGIANVAASPGITAPPAATEAEVARLAESVIPSAGIELPVSWGDLGRQLVANGVIDRNQFLALYQGRGGLLPDEQKLLDGNNNGRLKITPENSGFLLNLLWALGLGNKNPILDTGPMVDKRYGGAGNFASTGGWSLAKGKAMDHYSKHGFIKLNPTQQALVERVSQGIYRPCCNNATYFPDCNHGMAMLGLLELMAAKGVSEAEMYKTALQVNAYWFPDTYLTLAKYEATNNTAWEQVDPKKLLSAEYSSAGGFRAIQSRVQPVQQGGGGGCGV